jgi:hypothetical protein
MQTGLPAPDQEQKSSTDGAVDRVERERLAGLRRADDAFRRSETEGERLDAESRQHAGGSDDRAARVARHASAMRATRVSSMVERAVLGCVQDDPELTVEEILAALLMCAQRKTRTLLIAEQRTSPTTAAAE